MSKNTKIKIILSVQQVVWPILCSNLLYKKDHYFLDRQYLLNLQNEKISEMGQEPLGVAVDNKVFKQLLSP